MNFEDLDLDGFKKEDPPKWANDNAVAYYRKAHTSACIVVKEAEFAAGSGWIIEGRIPENRYGRVSSAYMTREEHVPTTDPDSVLDIVRDMADRL